MNISCSFNITLAMMYCSYVLFIVSLGSSMSVKEWMCYRLILLLQLNSVQLCSDDLGANRQWSHVSGNVGRTESKPNTRKTFTSFSINLTKIKFGKYWHYKLFNFTLFFCQFWDYNWCLRLLSIPHGTFLTREVVLFLVQLLQIFVIIWSKRITWLWGLVLNQKRVVCQQKHSPNLESS